MHVSNAGQRVLGPGQRDSMWYHTQCMTHILVILHGNMNTLNTQYRNKTSGFPLRRRITQIIHRHQLQQGKATLFCLSIFFLNIVNQRLLHMYCLWKAKPEWLMSRCVQSKLQVHKKLDSRESSVKRFPCHFVAPHMFFDHTWYKTGTTVHVWPAFSLFVKLKNGLQKYERATWSFYSWGIIFCTLCLLPDKTSQEIQAPVLQTGTKT